MYSFSAYFKYCTLITYECVGNLSVHNIIHWHRSNTMALKSEQAFNILATRCDPLRWNNRSCDNIVWVTWTHTCSASFFVAIIFYYTITQVPCFLKMHFRLYLYVHWEQGVTFLNVWPKKVILILNNSTVSGGKKDQYTLYLKT